MAHMFCKIDGIDGESTDDAHQNWIEIADFSHGVSMPVSAAGGTGGRTRGRADFQDFCISKVVDKSTPELNLLCANGKHVPLVEIECVTESDPKFTYLKYTLSDVIVSSVTPSGSGDGGKPMEGVCFAYGKIKWEYTPMNENGSAGTSIDRTWNLATGVQE